ncbi:T9SS type A sorting domain-containing protein [Cryomorpha ignava]|uniref:T9SS type A sorting domain-containing protein n=1 Tax=Cryomorpha ignava TaxID=101383 RepID=A0A7K3WLB7_9FLAO|nr:CotH kinase family protein [Cryomorpha ignava]NEN22284.1 T9SS type A sorting domain-containing protein [Cryomorpha ignava]
MKIIALLITFILLATAGFSQSLNIDVPEHRFRIDPYNKIIVIQRQNLDEYSDLSGFDELELTLLNFEFTFVEIPESLEFTGWYIVNNGSVNYNLFFTTLPLIKIQSPGNIPDEPKVPAEFYYADADQILIATIGIERRGGISQSYPKKTYDIEFWEDAETEISIDVQFGNMRNDDDWILDAMYNEPLRIRSKNAHQLWLDIHQPHYLQEKPNAKSGANVQYVELFLNGRYNGIYMLSEQIDRKLLKVEHFDGEIKGEIYKGVYHGDANNFWDLPDFDNQSRNWEGYEYEYPKAQDTTNWQNLYDFTDFVINSSDSEFEDVWIKFNYDNYLDYFIFLNVLRATDNYGKNIYTARLNSESPYFYLPWDLDGCFGTKWNGTYLTATDSILENGFMSRVIESDVSNYAAEVSTRYFELREGVLHPDSLIGRFSEAYELLKANNIYAREALVFPNYPYDQESFDYIANWTEERIAFLDIYFGYTVSIDEISERQNFVYPVPATNLIYVTHNLFYKNKQYSIYNLQGQTVQTGNISKNTIDISSIRAGFYIFKVGNLTQKIVVE